jgi:hypothetical protein
MGAQQCAPTGDYDETGAACGAPTESKDCGQVKTPASAGTLLLQPPHYFVLREYSISRQIEQ